MSGGDSWEAATQDWKFTTQNDGRYRPNERWWEMDVTPELDLPLTREQFVSFLEGFADSLLNAPDLWDNDGLECFLRAWAAWTVDMDGYFHNRGEEVPAEPTWKLMAQMLLAARVYE